MKLVDWLKIRTEFIAKARERDSERLSTGSGADEDIPFYAKTQDEMFIEVFERLQKLEEIFQPAPEVVEEKETAARTKIEPRFFPG